METETKSKPTPPVRPETSGRKAASPFRLVIAALIVLFSLIILVQNRELVEIQLLIWKIFMSKILLLSLLLALGFVLGFIVGRLKRPSV